MVSNSGIGVNNGLLEFATLYCGLLIQEANNILLTHWDGRPKYKILVGMRLKLEAEQVRACVYVDKITKERSQVTEPLPELNAKWILITEKDQLYTIRIVYSN